MYLLCMIKVRVRYVLVVCRECYNLGYIVKSGSVSSFIFVFENSNLLSYIQNKFKERAHSPV